MPVFNDRDHFIDKVARHSVQYPLKEWLIVVQIVAETEFRFELTPNVMVLANRAIIHSIRWLECKFLLQPIVKLVGIFPILAQSVHLDVAFFVAAEG